MVGWGRIFSETTPAGFFTMGGLAVVTYASILEGIR